MSRKTTETSTKHSTSLLGGDDGARISPEELNAVLGKYKPNSIKRFSQIHTIGLGGIGTVLSAYEKHLDRDVAIKMLRPAFRENRHSVNRFIQEARATAHIAHPNIVPVYELGLLKDIGPFFTMKRVDGVTLQDVLQRLKEEDKTYLEKYTLRHLLNIFIAICNGVAFAHSKNIIHRDLKPANIMLGYFGEVMVMDWGLVKHVNQNNESTDNIPDAQAELNAKDEIKTLDGEVTGTPAFMSPEQARGDNQMVDQQSDIYSLGAILYVILTRRRSPFPTGLKTPEILQLSAAGQIIPPHRVKPNKIKVPRELSAIVMKAMSLDKTERYNTVLELIRDVRNYLDDYPVSAYRDPIYRIIFKAWRRYPLIPTTVAVAFTTLAIAFGMQYYNTTEQFRYYMQQAKTNINYGNLMYVKGSKVYQQIAALRHAGMHNNTRKIAQLSKKLNSYGAALNNYYEVAEGFLSKIEMMGNHDQEVNRGLGHIMRNKIYYSLLTEDFKNTRRLVELMRLNRRPESYRMVRDNEMLYRKMKLVYNNEGIVSLDTIPTQRPIEIKNLFDPDDENAGKNIIKGVTPLQDMELKSDSYLLTLLNNHNEKISYPLLVEPGDIINRKIYLPAEIPDGMVYIPPGNFYSGTTQTPRRLMTLSALPGFFIKKTEVTFAEYLQFWRDIADPVKRQQYRSMILMDNESRTLIPAWNMAGVLNPKLKADYPVHGISHAAAVAYCRWLSRRHHRCYRLPSAKQWEKAARGVDGRRYVWNNNTSRWHILTPENITAIKHFPFGAPPQSFPQDCSIYGVYDMSGNVREYTSTLNSGSSNMYIVKGGSFRIGGNSVRCAFEGFAGLLADDIGFRYVTPLSADMLQKKSKLGTSRAKSTKNRGDQEI